MTASKLVNETAAQLKVELCEIKNTSNNDKEVILRLAKDIQCHVTGITKRYSEEIENLHRKLEEIVQSGTRETKVLELVRCCYVLVIMKLCNNEVKPTDTILLEGDKGERRTTAGCN